MKYNLFNFWGYLDPAEEAKRDRVIRCIKKATGEKPVAFFMPLLPLSSTRSAYRATAIIASATAGINYPRFIFMVES